MSLLHTTRNAASCTQSQEDYTRNAHYIDIPRDVAVCCSVLQCVAVCCSVSMQLALLPHAHNPRRATALYRDQTIEGPLDEATIGSYFCAGNWGTSGTRQVKSSFVPR